MQRVFWLALASAVVLMAFPASAQSRKPDPVTLALGSVRPALDFRVLSKGPAPSWESLEGRVVVMDFWATWCAPCVGAIPRLNALHHEFSNKDMAFISVTYEPDPHVREFLRAHPIDAQIGIDDSLATFKTFRAWGIPVVYIFDRKGKLVSAVHPDNLTSGVLSAALRGEIPDVQQSTPWSDPAGAEEYFRKNQRELREKYSKAGS